MKNIKIAICQNKPSRDKNESVEKIKLMIEEASDNGAELVVLPEIFYHPYELRAIPKLEESNCETLNILAGIAAGNKIHLCTGSLVEKVGNKRFNRSYLISPKGEILLEYSKSHLYDVNFEKLRTRESKVFDFGENLNIADTALGKIGIIICYDIRFPEMARHLALNGAEIIIVPAAFNTISGEAHWNIMFRCRAIESQVYLLAASPARDMDSSYQAYGHSMVIDPWGRVISEAGIDEQIIYSFLDSKVLSDTRNRLPLLKHRRPELYSKFKS
ncbi:MAG TPA: carbon-nitrogen hydrolase family protein [Victivallales bacterium]|nr:carbon-nitrogen hydrolase family protein [Victivallales bacterium]